MTRPISLSVFFPVYNEEKNLPAAVAQTLQALEESPYVSDFEIILVNDGSTDGSATLANTLAKETSGVRVMHHPRNMGYGQALKTGLAAAQKEYVFFTDADLNSILPR